MENKKFTKKTLLEMNSTATGLKKAVIEHVLDKWEDYTNKRYILSEIVEHGCVSGIVGELIYYKDTLAFYEKHKEEINKLLYEVLEDIGEYNLKAIFKDFDEQDPLCIEAHNQNLLSWFGFEETVCRIYNEFFW